MPSIQEAKAQLDSIIAKARTDMYKPIQIAEVLYQSRTQSLDISDIENFRIPSKQWRDIVTRRLLGKVSTSSSKYQDDIWNKNAMPLEFLEVLDSENKRTFGGVERYIYLLLKRRYEEIKRMMIYITDSVQNPKIFKLEEFLNRFRKTPELNGSIDKIYEIISYSLFETIVAALEAKIKIVIPESDLLTKFSDLVALLMGYKSGTSDEVPAHVYRIGVTNASDSGLDMWTNFGRAVQVKHGKINIRVVQKIVDRAKMDRTLIVIVCREVPKATLKKIEQENWKEHIIDIIEESHLTDWYIKLCEGEIGKSLIQRLLTSFKEEFPLAETQTLDPFLEERKYLSMALDPQWITSIDHKTRLIFLKCELYEFLLYEFLYSLNMALDRHWVTSIDYKAQLIFFKCKLYELLHSLNMVLDSQWVTSIDYKAQLIFFKCKLYEFLLYEFLYSQYMVLKYGL